MTAASPPMPPVAVIVRPAAVPVLFMSMPLTNVVILLAVLEPNRSGPTSWEPTVVSQTNSALAPPILTLNAPSLAEKPPPFAVHCTFDVPLPARERVKLPLLWNTPPLSDRNSRWQADSFSRLQNAATDRGCARVGIETVEYQCAGSGLRQSDRARD